MENVIRKMTMHVRVLLQSKRRELREKEEIGCRGLTEREDTMMRLHARSPLITETKVFIVAE